MGRTGGALSVRHRRSLLCVSVTLLKRKSRYRIDARRVLWNGLLLFRWQVGPVSDNR